MGRGADLLREAVITDGRVMGSLLLVDGFLNHRVDPPLLDAIGADLAERFAPAGPDVVVTAEASGIPPALTCAVHLGVPMVYAKKYLGPGDRNVFFREVVSPTRGAEYRVEIARRVLGAGSRVLIVDDFLAGGRTAEALGEIAVEAACRVVGFGFAIEKRFTGGRSRLESHGWRVEALITVTSLEAGVVALAD
ncbi:MAG: phosphoribosyltransferase family protein [Actinomycetota bacterium]|jgi:xanthine phosphoribosyltransferase|nr:xanthine phosphoribosyltransferase [Actinomycetota bacterium]